MLDKIWITFYNKEKKITLTKYFDTEFEKDKFKRKLKYIGAILIEDSTDIYFKD